MKFRVKYALALLVLCNVFVSFAQVKEVADIKARRKAIDTVRLVMPYVWIEAGKDGKRVHDSAWSVAVSRQLNGEVYTALEDKYNVLASSFTLSTEPGVMQEFFLKLDANDEVLPVVEVPAWMKLSKTSERYVVAVFFFGFYDAQYAPNFRSRQAMNNTLVVGGQPFYSSDIRLLLLDLKENRVLHCNSLDSKILDPRLPEDIERLASKVVKPIYYK
jgi:hypothetical protein